MSTCISINHTDALCVEVVSYWWSLVLSYFPSSYCRNVIHYLIHRLADTSCKRFLLSSVIVVGSGHVLWVIDVHDICGKIMIVRV